MNNGRYVDAEWRKGRQAILNRRLPTIGCLFLLALVLLGPARAIAAQAPYVLGAGDRVTVNVLGRTDLSGDFAVGASGDIALPLIGPVVGTGKTIEQLHQALAERYGQAMGSEPDLTVEVAQYRPFYILGNVRAAGAYPYVPGMTVLHAIALAGGELVVDQQSYRIVQDGAGARNEIGLLKRRRDSLLARRARLEAEQAGTAEIDFPDEIEGRPGAAEILRKERVIFDTRGNAMEQEIQLLERQADVFDEEIEALNGQREAIERQIRLVEEDIANVRDLVARKLVPRPRLTEQQKERAELERENRELGAFLARARQGRVNALESIKSRRAQQLRDLAGELRSVHQELDEVAIDLAGARERAALASASLAEEQARSQKPAIARYVIVRETDGAPVLMRAEPLTRVEPGDVVQVQIADGFDVGAPPSGALGAPAGPAQSSAAPAGARGTAMDASSS